MPPPGKRESNGRFRAWRPTYFYSRRALLNKESALSSFGLQQFLPAFSLSRRKPVVRLYFGLLLLLGLLCFRDYGVSWDEEVLRTNGMVSAKYVAGLVAPEWTARQAKFANIRDIHGHRDVDHGVLFELPLVLAAKALGVADSRAYYLMRHLAVFLVFMAGVWALYQLARWRLHSWRWGLVVCSLLVLSPRFFAEAFYNASDIVFMALFTLGVWTLVRFLRRPAWGTAAVHGLATAAAVDVRVLGVLLVAFTVGILLVQLLAAPRGPGALRNGLQASGIYLAVTAVGVVAGWPYLWEAPVQHLVQVFARLSQYKAWNGQMLYLGHIISGQQLPWHYAPVWILVTTPVAYVGAFLLGAGAVLAGVLRRPLGMLRTAEGRLDILFIGWFCLPLLLVIGLRSVLYDGWRHLYFIYPALLLLAGRGAQALWAARRRGPRLTWLVRAAAAVAGLELAYTAARMWRAHPQQQVYFSFLPPAAATRLFEGDYWGLSYRQGLEWVAAHDTTAELGVAGQNDGLIEKNLAIVKPEVRKRFKLVGAARARYYLTAYRKHPEPYSDSTGREVYRVQAYGQRVLSVFRRPGAR